MTPHRAEAPGRPSGYEETRGQVAKNGHAESNVFVTRVDQGTAWLAGVSDEGDPPNADCWESALSADGRHLLFASEADNLAPNDEDQVIDRFVRDRAADAP